jgi:hypothetical protein
LFAPEIATYCAILGEITDWTEAYFSQSTSLLATNSFKMPAMSPTMTEGNIASWKVREGICYYGKIRLIDKGILSQPGMFYSRSKQTKPKWM